MRASPTRTPGMGVAAQDYSGDGRPDLFVTNSRGQGHAAFRSDRAASSFANVRAVFAPRDRHGRHRLGRLLGRPRERRPARPRARERRHPGHEPEEGRRADPGAREHRSGRFADASAAVGLEPGPLVNGRGLAAADYDNDGRVDIAVNSIGGQADPAPQHGRARATGSRCAWRSSRPARVVTAVLPDGTPARPRGPGRQQLPLLRGPARPLRARRRDDRLKQLDVRWPGGKVTRLANVAADQIVTVAP